MLGMSGRNVFPLPSPLGHARGPQRLGAARGQRQRLAAGLGRGDAAGHAGAVFFFFGGVGDGIWWDDLVMETCILPYFDDIKIIC